MADDYTTLALVREALNSPTGHDNLLNAAITAASRSIDRHCGRRFYLDDTASARVLNPRRDTVCDRDGERLLVADIGNLTGFTVEVGRDPDWVDITSEVETEPTDALDLDPAEPVTSLLRELNGWTSRRLGRVRVTAQWGWPAVPDVVSQAALIQATRLYKRKDSPEGVLGSSEWGTVRVSRLDPDVSKLVEPFVLPGFA